MEEMIDLHLNGNLNLFFSDVIKCENYDIYYSDLIEDEYWNYAFIRNNNIDLRNISQIITNQMKQINRKPVMYIASNIVNEKLEQDIKNLNLNLIYTDCWMFLEDLNKFETYKSSIDFSIYKVDKELQSIFIKAITDGFSGDDPNDPYDSLSEGYKISIENSFQKNNNIINYIGMKKDMPVGTATVLYNNDKALIYNITTLKEYKRQGVCKQIMSYIINELNNLKIKEICLQTEKGYYTEEVYKKMGFKEKILGRAYSLL